MGHHAPAGSVATTMGSRRSRHAVAMIFLEAHTSERADGAVDGQAQRAMRAGVDGGRQRRPKGKVREVRACQGC